VLTTASNVARCFFLLRQAAATPGCNAIRGARCGLEAPLARALVTW
jgi:hypothetical protein